MPDFSAGSASIKISPSFKNFVRDANTELKAMNLSPLYVQIKPATADADAQIEKFRTEAGRNIGIGVDVDATKAKGELDELQRARVALVEARIEGQEAAKARLDDTAKARLALIEAKTEGVEARNAELDQLARAREAKIQAKVDQASSDKVKADLDGVEKAFGKIGQSGILNLKIVGVVGASGAIADLLAVGQAAAQAARAVALIAPAGGFAALAGIGSAAAGISGIPGAFKALSAASKDSAASAISQHDALVAVGEAEYQVQQANREQTSSQQDLTAAYKDANRSIRDMNDSLVDQKFATEDAALGVQEAAKHLQEVQNDPTADSTSRQRALLSYQESIQRLKEQGNKTQDLQQDTDTANQKGVEGSKQVVDAKQKVVDATHAQQKAAEDLTKAQESANKGSSSQSALTAALAKLSPNAKGLVNDIHSIGPAWHDAQQAAQDALTGTIGPALQHLSDVQMPNVKAGMVGINTAFNTGLKGVLASLSSDANKADLKTSLDNTATGFANAAKGARPLTDAVTKLITIGTSEFPALGTAIDHAAEKFNEFIQRGAADGSLKTKIDDGIRSLDGFVQVAEHVGSSIGSVFKAAGDNGATLKSIDDMTAHLSAFLKSTQGQTALKDFFETTRGYFDKLKPILGELPELLKGVYGGFQTWSGIALPFLHALSDLLGANPGLVRDAVTAYLAFKTVGPIFDAVKSSIKFAGDTVDAFKTGLKDAKTATKDVADEAASAAGEGGVGKLSGAAGSLGKILSSAGPLGIGALTAGIGLGLDYLVTKHQAAAQAADDQRQHEEQLQQTLDAQTGQATQQTLTQVAQDLEKGGDLKRAQQLGINTNDLVRAASGIDTTSKDAINQQLTQVIQKGGDNAQFRTAQGYTGLSNATIAQALQGVPEAVKAYTDALPAAQTAATQNHERVDDLGQLKQSLTDNAQAAATLGGELNNTDSAMSRAGEAARRQSEAANGLFALTEQGTKDFGDLKDSIVSVPDAKTVVVKALTQDQQANLEKLGDTVEKLPDGTIKITVNDAQANADIQKITTAPYAATVQVNYVANTQSLSVATLKALHGDTVPAAPGRAGGGPIDGGIPGKDSVPIMGMPGEHMLTTADVNKLGGQAGVYRFRAALQQGAVGHYDVGGAVGTPAASRSQALDDFARAHNGDPYVLGAEDCSGFISELANVAVGRDAQAGRMSTANEGPWLAALGFQNGTSGPGAFRVGWVSDASMAAGGHTAGTLPSGVNVESGGSTGKVMYGGAAIGADASLFTQHAFLQMSGTVQPGGTADSSNIGTQSVLYPQAPSVGRASDAQIQTLTSRSAVDNANSERNQVYANPSSTAQDKQAADIKLEQAQNSYESAQKSAGSDTSDISLQGIFSRAGGIIAGGILSGLGLDNSILSSSNVYNKAGNDLITGLATHGQLGTLGSGYAYQPQNLPQIADTSTPQSDAAVNNPALSTQIPGAGPVTGNLAVNPNLGSTSVNVPGATTSPTGANGPAVQAVQNAVAALGWNIGPEWAALDQLISHESSWNPTASAEPASDAYGLFQFLSTTWSSVGGQQTSDPSLQALYGEKYIQQRYGDPINAWNFWQSQSPHWYDDGGEATGIGVMLKNTIRPERVLNPDQTETFNSALPLLDSINSAAWSPNRIDSGSLAQPAPASQAAGRTFAPVINARVADVSDLADLVERQAHKDAIGLMAAMPA